MAPNLCDLFRLLHEMHEENHFGYGLLNVLPVLDALVVAMDHIVKGIEWVCDHVTTAIWLPLPNNFLSVSRNLSLTLWCGHDNFEGVTWIFLCHHLGGIQARNQMFWHLLPAALRPNLHAYNRTFSMAGGITTPSGEWWSHLCHMKKKIQWLAQCQHDVK